MCCDGLDSRDGNGDISSCPIPPIPRNQDETGILVDDELPPQYANVPKTLNVTSIVECIDHLQVDELGFAFPGGSLK
jgi:hypothetical protein